MICPACHHPNQPEANFCSACGVDLDADPRVAAAGREVQPVEVRKGLAISSLVFGVISLLTLGLTVLIELAGIVLGLIALRKIRNDPGRYGGKGIALAGIAASVASIGLVAPAGIIAAIVIPNMIMSRHAANEAAAIDRLRQIGKAESAFFKENRKFGTLDELAAAGYVGFRGATSSGYRFFVKAGTFSFYAVAVPQEYGALGTGRRSFYMTYDYVIHHADRNGSEATAEDPPIS